MRVMYTTTINIAKRLLLMARVYRLSVYVLFVAFLYAYWSVLPIKEMPGLDARLIVGAVFTLGLAWVYIFNKLYDEREDAISQPDEMLPSTHRSHITPVLWTLALLPVLLLLVSHMPLWPYLLYIFIGFVYSYPLYKGKRVKNFLILKNVFATFGMLGPIWFGLYVYFPPLYTYEFAAPFSLLAALVCFYIVGELIWDIRDTKGDAAAGVTTLPVACGVTCTKLIALGFLAIAGWLLTPLLINVIVIGMLAIFVIYTSPERPRWFFHVLLVLLAAILIAYSFSIV